MEMIIHSDGEQTNTVSYLWLEDFVKKWGFVNLILLNIF